MRFLAWQRRRDDRAALEDKGVGLGAEGKALGQEGLGGRRGSISKRAAASMGVGVKKEDGDGIRREGVDEDPPAVGQGTRALIIASEVNGVFCAGADLKERRDMTSAEYVSPFTHHAPHPDSSLITLPSPWPLFPPPFLP